MGPDHITKLQMLVVAGIAYWGNSFYGIESTEADICNCFDACESDNSLDPLKEYYISHGKQWDVEDKGLTFPALSQMAGITFLSNGDYSVAPNGDILYQSSDTAAVVLCEFDKNLISANLDIDLEEFHHVIVSTRHAYAIAHGKE